MDKKVNVIGQMDNSDGTYESANRVYGNASPTIPTCGGGGLQPKVIKRYHKPKNVRNARQDND